MNAEVGDEDAPMDSVNIDTKATPLFRIWLASTPAIDTTPDPQHGTVGFHVHAWANEADWKAGRKAIDQTFLAVSIDGLLWGES